MEWPVVPVEQVAEINPKSVEWHGLAEGDQVSFVPMHAVSEATASITTSESRTLGEVKRRYTAFREGDVLFAKITPCMENGKVAIARNLVNGVGFGSTEFHVLRAGSQVLPEFLYYFVRQPTFRAAAKQQMRGGAGQQRVPELFLRKELIPLPPLSEQHRIVEILDQADRLRRLRTEADAKSDRILPALFIKMFGDPATNPMGWPVLSLEEFADIKGGKRLPKGESYASSPTPFPYIRGVDILPNHIRTQTIRFLTREIQRRISRYTVSSGDVVITIAGKIGVCAPVPPSLNGANLTENAAKITPFGSDAFDATYLSAALNLPFVQLQISAMAGHATIGKLALFRIQKLRVPLPPIVQQRNFAAVVAQTAAVSERIHSSADHLNSLFSNLLSAAFSGSLTASWRKAHMKELLQEMEQQANARAEATP